MLKMTDKIGRQKAHELLKHLSTEEDFLEAVKGNEIITKHFTVEEIKTILDPNLYAGLAVQIVENMVSSLRI